MQPRISTGVVPVEAGDAEANVSDVDYFGENPLMVPVLGVEPSKVPDTFNESRDDGERKHRATDILAPKNTPVLAAESGTIIRISENHLGGNTIYMLDAHRRFLYYYAHLDHYASQLTAGMTVVQGEVLGYVGMTGNAPVNHLHFQAMRWDSKRRDYWNCEPVDVLRFFTLTGQERDVAETP